MTLPDHFHPPVIDRRTREGFHGLWAAALVEQPNGDAAGGGPGDEKVSVSMKGAILCPIAIVVGAMYAALGERAKAIFGTREDPSWLAWVICIPLVLAVMLLYLWLRSGLDRRGYEF